ncbi:Transposon TX1 uncharacterized protein [Merluccius polli]|uniref:Transposon TX1 uncharacterized protein n=1 Tax=Merluccius polli TaxID=89951 RepID=A0AA47MTD3_MERPO|nr:Transposon TX1 uncharacterized protein [Merluccius polli]
MVAFGELSRMRGLKISTSFPSSVEDCSLAVAKVVGHSSVKSAARMNGAVVIFVDSVAKANKVVESGIVVKDSFVSVSLLTTPAARVTISNMPPFIGDEALARELSRYGKIVSAIRKLPSGCKSPLLRHVVSHRWQVHMILNNKDSELSLVFKFRVDDFDYAVFVNSGTLKCFACRKEGHLARACPEKVPEKRAEPADVTAGSSKDADAVEPGVAGVDKPTPSTTNIESTKENAVTGKRCGENPKNATQSVVAFVANVANEKQVVKHPENKNVCIAKESQSESVVQEEGNNTITAPVEAVEAGPISAAAELSDSEDGLMEEEESCKSPHLKRKQASEKCGSKAKKSAASEEQEEQCNDEETESSEEEEMEEGVTDSQPLTDSPLLSEPLVCGARLDIQDASSPGLSQRLRSRGVLRLRQLVDVAGPGLHNTQAVASLLGLRSSRHTRHIVNQWNNRLSREEKEMLRDYISGAELPDESDPFPELSLSVDQTGLTKPMGISKSMLDIQLLSGKTLYKYCVETEHEKGLSMEGKAAGPGASVEATLQASTKQKNRRPSVEDPTGGAGRKCFISKINPTVSETCPFCDKPETLVHCYLDCNRLSVLFHVLKTVFLMCGEVWTEAGFIGGAGYNKHKSEKLCLLNFVVGQGKMAIYKSRKNMVEGKAGLDVRDMFRTMVKVRIRVDFNYHKMMGTLGEPLVCGARLEIQDTSSPGLSQRLRSRGVVRLRQLVDVAGPGLHNTQAVASLLGLRSSRHTRHLLNLWNDRLSREEKEMLRDYISGAEMPDQSDPFPELSLSVDQTGLTNTMGTSKSMLDVQLLSGKTLYKYCVVAAHKVKLSTRRDSVWKERLQGRAPVWRLLYKPPLNKRTGDLQWRILQGALAVNVFISKVNPTVSESCPFCDKPETLVHCYLDCYRLRFLFHVLKTVFLMCGEVWTEAGFIGGAGYNKHNSKKWCLLNFVVGQAKMAIYKSRKNMVEGKAGLDVREMFRMMVKVRIRVDFNYHKLMGTLEEFTQVWCCNTAVCSTQGGKLSFNSTVGPSVAEKFVAAHITTLGHVVDLCGPHLEDDAAALSAAVGVSSVRLIRNMLRVWKNQLSPDEHSSIVSQTNSLLILRDTDPFPVESLALDFKDCSGWFLEHGVSGPISLSNTTGKVMYKLLVKVINRDKLKGRADTPWRVHLGLNPGVGPSWRSLYKPPLTKRVGDLQWRILHGAVAVNGFVSILNPSVDEKCPFCSLRETVFHCFLDCSRLQALFAFLKRLFYMYGVVFTKHMFILGFMYRQKQKAKCQLLNFLLGQAKMAVYLSRKRKLEESLDCDAKTILIRMIKSSLMVDFNYYSLMKDLVSFEKVWCVADCLCSVKEEKLLFAHILV